ncbi:hypothetical protein Moror_12204 [Moniliophthora roreri MCA 2997]|uniref:RING-type domain-containing protein n=1 Tax=Moniliophthora roreri (strain MCA 2997) TaxID=1381753 RepID=V2WQ70_MONRO|nr:hypothetical protein Moror_12204 [Moniliophthora roreri MCA 2997]
MTEPAISSAFDSSKHQTITLTVGELGVISDEVLKQKKLNVAGILDEEMERLKGLAQANRVYHGKIVECSICLSLFMDPRILDCGHTFCGPCISARHKVQLGIWTSQGNVAIKLPDCEVEEFDKPSPTCPLCQGAIWYPPIPCPTLHQLVDDYAKHHGIEITRPELDPFFWPEPHPKMIELVKKRYEKLQLGYNLNDTRI